MRDSKELKSFIETALLFALQLLKQNRDSLLFPTNSGVYLIYNQKREIIYVGKSKNIKGRIGDHMGGGLKKTTSFRGSLHEKYKIPYGKEMKKWVKNRCSFVCTEIPNADTRSLVEALLIAYLRKTAKLLNKH